MVILSRIITSLTPVVLKYIERKTEKAFGKFFSKDKKSNITEIDKIKNDAGTNHAFNEITKLAKEINELSSEREKRVLKLNIYLHDITSNTSNKVDDKILKLFVEANKFAKITNIPYVIFLKIFGK